MTLCSYNLLIMKRFYLLIFGIVSLAVGCKNNEPPSTEVPVEVTEETQSADAEIDSSLLHDTSRPDGVYSDKNEKGTIVEKGEIRNGVQVGKRTTYFDNGAVHTEENYVNGSYEGPFKEYKPNGKLFQEGQYSNNAMSGVWKTYYDTGELKEEVTFIENNENGPFKEYHKNGKVKYEGTYKNGDHEDGEMRVYNEDGELIKKLDCKAGDCNTIWIKKGYEDVKR